MRGAGFLAIWSDVERNDLTDYRHWLTREHTTERVTTKGFLATRVFQAVRTDIHRFFILSNWRRRRCWMGPPYLARLNAPTPWTQRIMPKLGNFVRGGGAMTAGPDVARGLSSWPFVWNISGKSQRLAAEIAGLDGIAAVQIGVTDLARTSVKIVEKGMRQHDVIFAGLMLIEALDQTSLRNAMRRVAEIAPNVLDNLTEPEIYQGTFALDGRLADVE